MNRLPVIGSTAKTTAFCSEVLTGPGGATGLYLNFDGNGKITAANGSLHAPKANAFSLVEIADCPQSTPTCRQACYVQNLKAAQPDLHAMYVHNSRTIREILADPALANDWAMRVASWITMHAAGGFRWHVSGDVYSLEYANWIADVCRESPTVDHWIYTRSFDFLAPLAEVSTLRGGNLAINLSCDVDNYEAACDAAAHYGDVEYVWDLGVQRSILTRLRLCYLTVDGIVPNDLGTDDVIFPDYQLRPRQHATLAESPWWQSITQHQRGLVCPVDAHGKAENRRCGPCSRCLK